MLNEGAGSLRSLRSIHSFRLAAFKEHTEAESLGLEAATVAAKARTGLNWHPVVPEGR